MKGQFLKLLIILDVCWWLTVSFAAWQYSSGFPQQVVSTVVVLGVLSVLGNVVFGVSWLLVGKSPARMSGRLVQAFILLSTMFQAFLLTFFILQ